MDELEADGEKLGAQTKGGGAGSPHLSEQQRAVRAVALGAALGLVLLVLGRRRAG